MIPITVAACFLVGCAASHYHLRQSDRVTLYLRAPDAEEVLFASSLDGFTPHPTQKVGGFRWAVSVSADSEFRYFYILDGSVHVPDCKFSEKDDFGSRNCIYIAD
jgi:hypothetical protein